MYKSACGHLQAECAGVVVHDGRAMAAIEQWAARGVREVESSGLFSTA